MNSSQVILKIIENEGLNKNSFSKALGTNYKQVCDIINGDTKSITEKFARKILSAFPEYNKVWLLTGKGNMLKNASAHTKEIRHHENIEERARNLTILGDEREKNFSVITTPGFEDCTKAINILGNNMFLVLKSDEFIILKEWKESFIDYGKIYLVKGHINKKCAI